jgi:A/G-specific adenine glycosylase
MQLTDDQKTQFLDVLWKNFRARGRHDLPWRLPEAGGSFDLYKILVSEIMLQQTQVKRVVAKYQEFLSLFPTVTILASADLGDVLRAWQGLGYNRRAKYLWLAARTLDAAKKFPQTLPELTKLPGVGENTAGAILAYAYNLPTVFIETNVRTVYLHHFVRDSEIVSDSFIRDLLEQTLDREAPREFYWALMDYGTELKALGSGNLQSKQYKKQSTFHGSKRQVRGRVIDMLRQGDQTLADLQKGLTDGRLTEVLEDLTAEGLIAKNGHNYHLGGGTI